MYLMFPKLIFFRLCLTFLLLSLFSTKQCQESSSQHRHLSPTEAATVQPGAGSLCRKLRSPDRAFDAAVRTSSRSRRRASRCVLRLRPFVSPTWPTARPAFSQQPAYTGVGQQMVGLLSQGGGGGGRIERCQRGGGQFSRESYATLPD